MIGSAISGTSRRAAGHAARCGLLAGFSGDDPVALVEAGPDLDRGAVIEAGLDLALAHVTRRIGVRTVLRPSDFRISASAGMTFTRLASPVMMCTSAVM
jgi:hypothetical protein